MKARVKFYDDNGELIREVRPTGGEAISHHAPTVPQDRPPRDARQGEIDDLLSKHKAIILATRERDQLLAGLRRRQAEALAGTVPGNAKGLASEIAELEREGAEAAVAQAELARALAAMGVSTDDRRVVGPGARNMRVKFTPGR